MSAKVAFLSGEHSPTPSAPRIMVPDQATVSRDGRRVVFVLRQDRAVQTAIEAGASANGLTEVRTGIAPGDRVILNPPDDLQDGARVTPGGPVR
jgi:hypothetical protein